MTKVNLIESFDDLPSVSLTESTKVNSDKLSRVDGKYIIGMIEGQFFKPNGMSRNQRFYPAELWETVVNSADTKARCMNSIMFGEIGHSDGAVGDMTLRNGCASHFIDELWITPKNEGYGRAYILNTPTGQLLKTYLGAGCKLKVSSRGEGSFSEAVTEDGYPIIDPTTYELQTFDFVLNPGFLETNAVLKEEYEKLSHEPILTEEVKTVINHVKKGENSTMETNEYIKELKDEVKALRAENKSLTEALNSKEKELLQKQFATDEEVKKLTEAYEPYKSLKVSAKTISETFKKSQVALKKAKEEKAKMQEELDFYHNEAGTKEQLREATKISSKILHALKEYKAIGSVAEFKALKESANDLVRLQANAKKATAYVNEATEIRKLAKKAADMLEDYKNVGSVAEFKALKSRKVPRVSVKEAKELSKKFNITIENAGKLIRKFGAEKASSLLESKLSEKEVKPSEAKSLKESSELITEESKSDKAPKVAEGKTAKDFLSTGMIRNKFNPDAFGKEIKPVDLNNIEGQKPNAAEELLKKYQKPPVEKGVSTEKPKSAEEAEKAVKSLLKK